MNPELEQSRLNSFGFEGQDQRILFIETTRVNDDVECDVYSFDEDSTKDLGIIRIKPGGKTPLQQVLKGDKTIEGYVSGEGKLTITKADGTEQIYQVGQENPEPFSICVEVGDKMQWEGSPDSDLVAYEICIPPYEDGRYKNL